MRGDAGNHVNRHSPLALTLSGLVTSGRAEGAAFTQLDWAREQFIAELGIDPYPGTLNLRLDDPDDLAGWAVLKSSPGHAVLPLHPRWCRSRCYPVRLADRLPGAIVFPEVPNYPPAQVEIIAALPLRERLSLKDGDRLSLQVSQPVAARAVIFDVDGTLVDSLEAFRVVAELAAAPLGLPVPREVVRQSLNGDGSFWEMFLPVDLPNRAETIKQLIAEAMRRWPDVLRAHGRVFPGLRETLEALRAREMRMGIFTGSRGGSLEMLREAGLLDFFGAVVTRDDVQRRKPDPEGLLKCAEQLGAAPEEAVYVGDTPIDIRASQAAGMASVAILTGAGDSALLSAEGPDWIVHSHPRLIDIIAR